MLYPGYLLNPGDMFQVEPQRVLYATGAFKNVGSTSLESEFPEDSSTSDSALAEADAADLASMQDTISTADLEAELAASPEDEASPPDDPTSAVKKTLATLRARALTLVSEEKKTLSSKRKVELRAFAKTIKTAISRAAAATPSTIDDLESQLAALTLSNTVPSAQPTTSEAALAADASPLSDESPEMLAAIAAASENPHDPSKPYATPWRPREWMSAFAFIPRYLEVNQKICAAVYLRHPVVKPGLAEVPTPFHAETGQLAFNWYLRRR